MLDKTECHRVKVLEEERRELLSVLKLAEGKKQVVEVLGERRRN